MERTRARAKARVKARRERHHRSLLLRIQVPWLSPLGLRKRLRTRMTSETIMTFLGNMPTCSDVVEKFHP